jgi:hypothetical protein
VRQVAEAAASSEPGHELIGGNKRLGSAILPPFSSDPPFSETSDARVRSTAIGAGEIRHGRAREIHRGREGELCRR